MKLKNSLAKELLNFLKNSRDKFILPEYEELYIKEDENDFNERIFSSFISLKEEKIESFYIILLLFFSLMDIILSVNYPKLEEKGFKEKYKGLPDNTDEEKIFKGLYRIMRVIRNNLIHNPSNITSQTPYSVNYTHGTRNFLVDFKNKEKDFYLILTIIYIISHHNVYYSYLSKMPEYILGIIRNHYDQLINQLIKNKNIRFKDDIPGSLPQLSINGIRLVANKRYIIKNPNFSIENNAISITNINNFKQKDPFVSKNDFIISYNNKKYIIPEEILILENNPPQKGNIRISEIKDWEYTQEIKDLINKFNI